MKKQMVLALFQVSAVLFQPARSNLSHIWGGMIWLLKQASPLTDGLDGQAVYFVHSYFTDVPSQYIDVTADYSIEVPAMIHKDNVYGAQFHPEKSGILA